MAYLVAFCPRCEETKTVYEGLALEFEGYLLGEEVWRVDGIILPLGYCKCGEALVGEVHKIGESRIIV